MSTYMKSSDIAHVTHSGHHTVNRALRLSWLTGSVIQKSLQAGRPRLLTSPDAAYLEACIECTLDIFIHELQSALRDARGVNVSRQTIEKTLRIVYERHDKLNLLALYLKNQPDHIPLVPASATAYGFDFYVTDDEDQNNGPIIFKEQGAGPEGVVDVLKSYLEKHKHSNEVILLHKWLDDLITAAEHAYMSAKVSVLSG
ncbi:hypothetical protein BDR03DRAFT_1089447 [Suillus americanus]|nr:hypothetical protein BDR03DRAFT_1089447 [Suillus americanus]